MASNSKDTSQYLDTQITNWYLDILTPREVPASDFDTIVKIDPKYDKRPDLFSNDQYGTAALWWVFAVRNPDLLIDPIEDFVSGLTIFVPANILKG